MLAFWPTNKVVEKSAFKLFAFHFAFSYVAFPTISYEFANGAVVR